MARSAVRRLWILERLNMGSRVTREGNARFWERLGVKFPWATRRLLVLLCPLPAVAADGINIV